MNDQHLRLAADLDLPDALIEASSLGTPGALALRARARRERAGTRRAARLAGLDRVPEPARSHPARGLASSDADLLAAHAAGDPVAFSELIARHKDRMWAVALRTLRDPEEAADALQDAFISAFRAASNFRAESQITTWLHRIVVNACLDRVRRRQARPQVPLPDAGPDELVDPRDAIGVRETRLVVHEALAELTQDQRAAIVLVDVEGYTVAEAARVLSINEGTVKSRAARGRAKLAKILGHLREPSTEVESTSRLASSQLTRSYLEAGVRILRREFTMERTGDDRFRGLLVTLTRETVIAEVANGPAELPRRGSAGSFRDRWNHFPDYVSDLIRYTLRGQGIPIDRRLADDVAIALRGGAVDWIAVPRVVLAMRSAILRDTDR